MRRNAKYQCDTCQDTGYIVVHTIAGQMRDYCPICNFLGSGKSYEMYIREYKYKTKTR